jgi:hypothetical protein
MSTIIALAILFTIVLMLPTFYKIGYITGSESMRTKLLPNIKEKSLIPSIVADNTVYPRVPCA